MLLPLPSPLSSQPLLSPCCFYTGFHSNHLYYIPDWEEKSFLGILRLLGAVWKPSPYLPAWIFFCPSSPPHSSSRRFPSLSTRSPPGWLRHSAMPDCRMGVKDGASRGDRLYLSGGFTQGQVPRQDRLSTGALGAGIKGTCDPAGLVHQSSSTVTLLANLYHTQTALAAFRPNPVPPPPKLSLCKVPGHTGTPPPTPHHPVCL